MYENYLKRLPTTLYAWFEAIRPRTLSIPSMQVAVALALAYSKTEGLDPVLAFSCWIISVFITIAVNLFNDALDYEKGGDTANSKGFAKVIRLGLLSEKEVLAGGFLSLIVVFVAALPLFFQSSWLLPVIAISAFLSYSYTGGFFPICYLGLSEVFILAFYGFIAVGTTYYVQVGSFSWPLLLAILQTGFLSAVPNALNNFRDIDEDALVPKRTLAVRFGKGFCRLEIACLMAIPFLLNLLWLYFGYVTAAFLPFLSLPAAILLLYSINKHDPSPLFNQFFRLSAVVHLLFCGLLCLGLMI